MAKRRAAVYLLRSRMAANEASAVGSVRTLNTAQLAYSYTYPQQGFATSLATLGPDPRGAGGKFESAQHAGLIDASLASENCTPDGWCIKSGYRFRLTTTCAQRPCKQYVVVATPVNANTGTRNFCSTSDGVIHLQVGPPLTAPLTASECKSWTTIQ